MQSENVLCAGYVNVIIDTRRSVYTHFSVVVFQMNEKEK
jgi:hypothetical protein